jgi:flagellar biosynthesis/type III secretory pathway protein FliH
MKKSSWIPEAATLSFNKKVSFPEPPKGFRVKSVSFPPASVEEQKQKELSYLEDGKKQATEFYLAEVEKLKTEYGQKQSAILDQLNIRAEQAFEMLNTNLPSLVMEIVQKILPRVDLSGTDVEGLVRSLIAEFSDDEEKLEVYLCPEDLRLLKALGKETSPQDVSETEASEPSQEDGFASAIAGIFDNLDGEDSVLPDLPRVKFFEDTSLSSGDCQIKSRFGLLDGRLVTKLRKVGEELTNHG